MRPTRRLYQTMPKLLRMTMSLSSAVLSSNKTAKVVFLETDKNRVEMGWQDC